MRTWLMVVGGLSVWAAVANGQEQGFPPQTCAHSKMAAAKAYAGLSTRDGVPAPRLDRSADTDVQHYWLDLDVNPSTVWISGSNTMTVRSCVDDLTTFIFRLQSNFTMSAVLVGSTPVAWTRLDVANVQVSLDRPYNADEVFTLYVAYSGHPQQNQGLGSITFRDRYDAPEVFTLSEPWLSYTWWPGKDALTDKTTADLWFTVPNTMVVGSNGLLQGVDTIPPNKLRYRWLSTYPAADYLYSIAATNYHEFNDTWTYGEHSMPLQFFIYPEHDTPANRQDWLLVRTALTTYSDLFGLYPFINEKYGMAEFGWGGGMEHQTLTSIIGSFGWESGYVHELSHQWWGDDVTCATWHDIWLNEGFAVYSEALWYEHKPGSSGEPALHQTMAQRRPSFVFDTVYCYDISSVARVFDYNMTYLKAGWVMHMLRHVVGDTNFYAILAAYRAAYEGSSATTEDLRAVCEAVTGRDLAWFFAQWIYDQGAPAYETAWRQFVLDGQRYVELYISQIQSNSPPVFTMPVDVQVTQSGTPTIYAVWNDATSEHLLFPVAGGSISSLSFDPKPWILRTSRTTIAWVEGPPKIVTMNPAPNATAPAAGVLSFEVVFHKPVVAAASNFSLVGVRSGPVSVTYAYNATRNAVTLTPAGALATDTYTLTVADTIVDVASGQALDGDLVKPDGPNPLPSGDGIPGDPAVAQFFLTRAGDLNCDAVVDFDDINPFVLALSDPASYANEVPGCPLANADANGDGSVNFDDISPFVDLLGAQ
jgi:hypothetical protein